MIKFPQYNERQRTRIKNIVKFFNQASYKNDEVYFYEIHSNQIEGENLTVEWGLQFEGGDKCSVAHYLSRVIPDKISHYAEYEFRWVDGQPVKRDPVLTITSWKEEKLYCAGEVEKADSDGSPISEIDYYYKRIESLFSIDLDNQL